MVSSPLNYWAGFFGSQKILSGVGIVGTTLPPALLKGGGYDLPKIESLGVQIFLLERGDKPEKGG